MQDMSITYCILDSDYHTPREINERLLEAEEKGMVLLQKSLQAAMRGFAAIISVAHGVQ